MKCQTIAKNINGSGTIKYEQIFRSLYEQIEAVRIFIKIEKLRKHTISNHLLPGGRDCQDPCTFDIVLNSAADVQVY